MSDNFIRAQGRDFSRAGAPFFAVGVNSYFLGYCSDAARSEVLDTARKAGANTVRSWAFLDLEPWTPGRTAFQYQTSGKICQHGGPDGLERLDSLIAMAEARGLYLILPLLNYWPDFGGVPAYRRWLNIPDEPAAFFTEPNAREAYQRWIEVLVTRRNIYTGRLYLDEPAILAWELANEPRCEAVNGREVLLDWIERMSDFVKSLDRNHMVAVGDEGFFHRGRGSHLYDGRYGVDAAAIIQLKGIDFGTFHLYPRQWGLDRNRQVNRWIDEHLALGRTAGKPIVLEEFGTPALLHSSSFAAERREVYRSWIARVRDSGGAGALVWTLGSRREEVAGFTDRYTLTEDLHPSEILFL